MLCCWYPDVIEVLFLCQMAAVASNFGQCPSAARHRYQHLHNASAALTPDLILLRFKAVDMFLCIDANDARVRLKRIVSISRFSAESAVPL